MEVILSIGGKPKGLESIIITSCRLFCEGEKVSPLARVDYRLEGSEEIHSARLDLHKKKFLDPILGATGKEHKKILQMIANGIYEMVLAYCESVTFGEEGTPLKIVEKPFQKDFKKKKGPTVH